MQEIVAFCDFHIERDGERVLGEGYRIGISGSWKRLDLCPQCMKDLLSPLETVLQRHGQAVSDIAPELLAPPARRTTYTDEAYARKVESMSTPRQCLWCSEVVAGGYAKLKAHLVKHGLQDFNDAYGHTCPICLQDEILTLSAHIGRGHMVNLAEAFEWAYYGGVRAAEMVAESRRSGATNLGAPGRIDGTVERVAAARERWVAVHGEP